jgi:hypothetical protein
MKPNGRSILKALKLLVITLLFSSLPAFADQCQWNDRSVAQRARGFLAYHPGPVYTYCEPCGDTRMLRVTYGHNKEDTLDRRAVNFRWVSREQLAPNALGWEIVFNEGFPGVERKVDLAYTFVRSEQGFVNVGSMFGCASSGSGRARRLREIRESLPQGVSYFLSPSQVQVEDDVTDQDFIRAYESRYPDDAEG